MRAALGGSPESEVRSGETPPCNLKTSPFYSFSSGRVPRTADMGRSCAAGAGYRLTRRRAGFFPFLADSLVTTTRRSPRAAPPPLRILAVYSAVDHSAVYHSASQVSSFGKSLPVRIDFSNLFGPFLLPSDPHSHPVLWCSEFFIDFLVFRVLYRFFTVRPS